MITISPAPLQGRASLLEPLLLPEKAVLRQPPTAPSHRSGECKNMPAFNSKLSGNLQSLEFIRAGDAYSSLIHPHPGPTQVTGSASCQDSGLSNWLLGLSGHPLGVMPPASTPQLCFLSIPISQDWEGGRKFILDHKRLLLCCGAGNQSQPPTG